MATYLPRIVDGELERRLRSVGAVVIEGPKACGKTATATRIAQTVFRLDEDPAARSLIHNAPGQLFDNPRRSCSTNGRWSPRSGTESAARSMTARARASTS